MDKSSVLDIAGYCRISVDMEVDRDNTSIENQKSIIEEYVRVQFPEAKLTFYEDRDRSGYTFDQRPGYQKMRRKLMSGEHNILIIKDFSRFSRRNSKGLVELEDLRDKGVRIIAIGDGIDYPTFDDWMSIQFRFLVNEMPVTDASKKVKSVIANRQKDGKWLCAVPYGYRIEGNKNLTITVDEECAPIVRKIFELYSEGMGYRKIANYLTEQHIPTPRTIERDRKLAAGEDCKINARPEWSLITVSEILRNDFYIGTFRQAKYKRTKINGSDKKTDESQHIVFENHHTAIVDDRLFLSVQQQLDSRTSGNYRGVKKYENVYSGFLFCGDCGAPMFSISNPRREPAYTCGSYHRRGLKGCTSHFIKCETLDAALKEYIRMVRDNSADLLRQLDEALKEEKIESGETQNTVEILRQRIEDTKSEMKLLARQKVKEIARNPDNETLFEETYGEMLDDLANQIDSLENQIQSMTEKQSAVLRVNRTARTAIGIFSDIIAKDHLSRTDLEVLIDRISVYEDRVDIRLRSNIDALLRLDPAKGLTANFNPDTGDIAQEITQKSPNRRGKVIRVNVFSKGEPQDIVEVLKSDNLIYLNPLKSDENDPFVGWEETSEYLSGNVREKLRAAELYAKDYPDFQCNVAALTEVLPKKLEAGDITARIGVSWVDVEDYQHFLEDYAKARFYEPMRRTVTGEYKIENKNWDTSAAATQIYGTARMPAKAIFENLLNNRDIVVKDKITDVDGKEHYEINKKQTDLAQDKALKMKEAFMRWLWEKPERREKYVGRYNNLFNSIVGRKFEGSHQTFPGMSPSIRLKSHQLDAVMRAKFGGNTLLAHCVGAGKSFEMVVATMEKKRLGLINKACVVVPKHLVGQMANEWLRLYPQAKILTASEKDFDKDHRQKFIGRCCTGDYDAVIMSYEQFEKIPMSMEYRKNFIQHEIDAMQNGIDELNGDYRTRANNRSSIKDLEREKKRLETRLQKLIDGGGKTKDTSLTFEQLGFDSLVVDEAHNYKNGLVVSKMNRVSGVQTTPAQKSEDILMKTQYLNENYGEKNIIFATGTPAATPYQHSNTEFNINARFIGNRHNLNHR